MPGEGALVMVKDEELKFLKSHLKFQQASALNFLMIQNKRIICLRTM